MAMPVSGTIGLRACYGGTCTSIGCGVCGSLQTPTSLCSISIAAGKTAPHAMSEFYCFARETSFKQIGFCNISAIGTNGTVCRCSVDCICSNSAMVAGQCYTITLCHQICSNTCTGSRSYVQVCGVSAPYCCVVINGQVGVNFSCSFVVKQSDTVCIISCALHATAGGTCCSCAHSCITTVAATLGLFCRTTGVYDCTVYACS